MIPTVAPPSSLETDGVYTPMPVTDGNTGIDSENIITGNFTSRNCQNNLMHLPLRETVVMTPWKQMESTVILVAALLTTHVEVCKYTQ